MTVRANARMYVPDVSPLVHDVRKLSKGSGKNPAAPGLEAMMAYDDLGSNDNPPYGGPPTFIVVLVLLFAFMIIRRQSSPREAARQ